MGASNETYVHRHPVKRAFERIPNEAGRMLSPVALGVLTEALTYGADGKRRMTADEIYKRWKPRLGSVAPSRAQIQAAFNELTDAGYRHVVERRRGSAWLLAATWHNAPAVDCGDKRCRTCRARSDTPEIDPSETCSDTPNIDPSEQALWQPSGCCSDTPITDASAVGGSSTNSTTTTTSDRRDTSGAARPGISTDQDQGQNRGPVHGGAGDKAGDERSDRNGRAGANGKNPRSERVQSEHIPAQNSVPYRTPDPGANGQNPRSEGGSEGGPRVAPFAAQCSAPAAGGPLTADCLRCGASAGRWCPLTVQCPWCNAPAWHWCVNKGKGRTGGRADNVHDERKAAAGLAAELAAAARKSSHGIRGKTGGD